MKSNLNPITNDIPAISNGELLNLIDIEKKYGKVQALKKLNLKVLEGEIISILGPSGAGKTTTLKIIAGLEKAEAGKIIFKNKIINNLEPKERNMAMVFETYALYPHISVFDNLASPLNALKMKKDEIKSRVENIAGILGMKPYLDRKPANLSGGQRQRVALGRALVKPADLYLMDEPIAHLDAKLRFQMTAEFKNLQSRLNISIIYVTHDWREALSLGNHVLVLNNGEIEQYSTAEEIFNHPNNTFVAQIVGDPPMNLIPGEINFEDSRPLFTFDGLKINFNDLGLITKSKEKVILGIRPNKISISGDNNPENINAVVYSIEKYGVNTVVALKISNIIVKTKFKGRTQYGIGEKVNINFDLNESCLFDINKKMIQVLGRNSG